jgi:serine/threonine-protein kinase
MSQVQPEQGHESMPLLDATDKTFDLIYGEFLLREEMGEEPKLDDFLSRFPQYAAEFQKQAKVHEAIESSPSPDSTKVFSGVSGDQRSQTEYGNKAASGWLGASTPHSPLSGGTGEVLAAEADWPVIPGYTILAKLGQGGMGQVFKAMQIRLDRVVALKVIRKECLSQEPKAARRFQREAQAAAQLSHPNIIVVYDFNQVGETYYIAMEYVDGVDLDQLIRDGGPLPVERAIDFIRQAALGLQHAYVCGMVHRDIKPSNLLIALPKRENETKRPGDKDIGRPGDREITRAAPVSLSPSQLQNATLKILDMGMALLLHGPQGESANRTVQGTLMGTPDFIAPEQAVDSHEVDIRADLYSLGCTFYFLLTGRPPFSDYPLLKKLMMHQTGQARPVREWQSNVPPVIEGIVQRLMAKRPEDRYQTPGELADALAGLSLQAMDPIFGSLAEAGLLKASPKEPGRQADRERGRQGDREITRGAPLSLSPSLPVSLSYSQPSILPRRSSNAGPNSAERVAVLKGHGSWVMALAFSPNRKTLASGAVHGAIRLWNFSGRRQWDKADLQTQLTEVHVLAFSPNNIILAAGSGSFDGLTWLWDISTPNLSEIAILQGHHTPVEAIAFSPDGKMIVTGGSDKTVRWWDLGVPQAKERAVFKGHFDRIKAVAFAADGKTLISAGLDGTVRLWRKGRIWSRDQLEVLEGPWGPLHTMAISPLGNALAFGGLDQTVRLYSLPKEMEGQPSAGSGHAGVHDPRPARGCQPLAVLRGHGGVVRLVAFTPKGDSLVSICDAGRVIVWEIASGNKLQEWQLPAAKMCSLAVTHDAHYLAAGTSDGVVNVFRLYAKKKEPEQSESGPPSLPALPTE